MGDLTCPVLKLSKGSEIMRGVRVKSRESPSVKPNWVAPFLDHIEFISNSAWLLPRPPSSTSGLSPALLSSNSKFLLDKPQNKRRSRRPSKWSSSVASKSRSSLRSTSAGFQSISAHPMAPRSHPSTITLVQPTLHNTQSHPVTSPSTPAVKSGWNIQSKALIHPGRPTSSSC